MGYEDEYEDFVTFKEVFIDPDKCIACLQCALLCPANAIIVEETALIDKMLCRKCGECYTVCKSGAIFLRKE